MSSKPNVCLYFDDFRGVGRLPDADRGKLFSAILAFSESGIEPDFGDAALLGFAWDSIRPKLIADDERYQANAAQKRYAAYCRKTGAERLSFDEWRSSADTARYRPISADISREPYSYSDSASSSSTSSSSAADADTVKQSAAAAVLNAYGIPKTKAWMDTLTEDIDRCGMDDVKKAMKKAGESDKYGGVSINFYRAILNGTGTKKGEESDYLKRHYGDDYWRGLEPDMDAAIDAGEGR